MGTSIGTLTIEMAANIGRLTTDMSQAKDVVGKTMKSIEGSVQLARTAFIGLTGITSVGMFASMINESIAAEAELKRLSIQTGVSVEALSAIKGVAKSSGTDVGTAAAAMNKLQKNLAGANEESKGAAQALKALGVNFEDFQRLKADEQMLTVAKAMDRFQDGGGKSAAAMMLFGKSGAQLLPMMQELAEKNELVGKVTTENAERALEYEKNMRSLEAAGNAWKRQLAEDLLPTLVKTTEAMVQARRESGTFAMLLEGFRTFFTGDDHYKNAVALTEQTELLMNAERALAEFRHEGYAEESKVVVNVKAQIAAYKEALQTTLAYRKELEHEEEIKKKAATDREAERAKNGELRIGNVSEAGLQLLNRLKKEYEAATGGVNTYIDSQRALAAIKEPVAKRMQDEILHWAKLIDQQRNAKLMIDSWAQAMQAIEAARDSANEKFTAGLRSFSEQGKELEFQTRLIGRQAEEVERLNYVRRVDLDLMKIEAELGNARGENLITETEYTQRLALARQAAADALARQQSFMDTREARLRDPTAGMKDALLEYEKTVARVANSTKSMMANAFRGMEDALVNFVKTGQLDFTQLADSIISDMIRIQVQQAITGPLANAMSGYLSGGGAAGNPEAAGGYGPIAGQRAEGGPVMPGRPYLVGEKGPEIIVPQAPSAVIPNGAAGGRSITYAPVINIDARSDRAAVNADVQRALARNNEQFTGLLRQQGVLA